jgi:hypothetical protein
MSQANGAVTVAAIEKQRNQALKEMTPACRDVAKEFEHKLHIGQSGLVKINYEIGARVAKVLADEGKYGSNAVEQLSQYLQLGGGATTLYQAKEFSEAFEFEFVQQQMARTMTGGGALTTSHWFALAKVESKAKQKELLEKVFKNGWSANALEQEIRSSVKTKNARQGGRKPGIPTSPMAGIQKGYSMLLQFNNLEPVLEEHVCDVIDEIDAEHVTKDMVDKLDETLKIAAAAQERLSKLMKRLEKNKTRATKVLEQKYEQAEKNREEMEEDEEPKKPKKKVVNKKPQAATASA